MGFWYPRAICPNCGAKIHTQGQLAGTRTGKTCPYCHIELTGEVGAFSGKAKIRQEDADVAQKFVSSASSSSGSARPPEQLAEESAAPVGASGADIAERLAQLVQMKEAGHLTPEEFEDAKRQALGNKQFENTSKVPDQVEFDVILESSGSQEIGQVMSQEIRVMITVRRLTGLGRSESIELVEGAPKPVLQGVSKGTAARAKAALENVGATVTIK